MKIMIVSDSHRQNNNILKALEIEEPIDLLIHCGDIEKSEEEIKNMCNCQTVMVRGNNDLFSELNNEEELLIGNYSVLVTHGHLYSVSLDTEMLKDEARSRYCDLVFYGHTHRPEIDLDEDITVINPGSISFPRQSGRKKSYCIMTINEKKEAVFELKYL